MDAVATEVYSSRKSFDHLKSELEKLRDVITTRIISNLNQTCECTTTKNLNAEMEKTDDNLVNKNMFFYWFKKEVEI